MHLWNLAAKTLVTIVVIGAATWIVLTLIDVIGGLDLTRADPITLIAIVMNPISAIVGGLVVKITNGKDKDGDPDGT